jgi:hypothetical protein
VKFTNKVVGPMEPRGSMQSRGIAGTGTAGKRIDRIRRELGLSGRAKRRYRPQTTDSSHEEPIAPNRLAQLPKATRRDQIWVSDITYIPTEEGSRSSCSRYRTSERFCFHLIWFRKRGCCRFEPITFSVRYS